jgi:hypothetical protein
VPAHSGQTSAAVFIMLSTVVLVQLCTRSRPRRKAKPVPNCAHPVESGGGLWRIVEKRTIADCKPRPRRLGRTPVVAPGFSGYRQLGTGY